MNGGQVVVDVRDVSKKYCRQLKRSLWYGVRDLCRELSGSRGEVRRRLRPGEFFAVRHVSFQVRRGECVSLLGPNGSGKSTMLKMLNGLLTPDTGRIEIRGRVGALIELGTGFNPLLSGRENVYINAAVLGLPRSEVDRRFDRIVSFAELEQVIDTPVQTYSSGMRVRLGFSVAAHLRPQLLLMDEVLAVGDVGFRMKCFDHIRQLVRSGISIILVSHAVGMLPRVSERAIVFDRGQLVFDGDLQAGISRYEQLLGQRQQQRDERSASGESTGQAWIQSVTVRDQGGRECSEFHTGDTVAVEIQLGASRVVAGARLIAALNSPQAGVIASVSTPFRGFDFDLLPPGTTIRLEFPELPLLVGGYSFTISLFGATPMEFYQRATAVGAFRIIGPPVNADGYGITGHVNLPHQWSMVSLA